LKGDSVYDLFINHVTNTINGLMSFLATTLGRLFFQAPLAHARILMFIEAYKIQSMTRDVCLVELLQIAISNVEMILVNCFIVPMQKLISDIYQLFLGHALPRLDLKHHIIFGPNLNFVVEVTANGHVQAAHVVIFVAVLEFEHLLICKALLVQFENIVANMRLLLRKAEEDIQIDKLLFANVGNCDFDW
jgi:hypothetical protein